MNNENQVCQVCGTVKKLVPAGVSKKTGKAYQAFFSCPNRCSNPSPSQNASINVNKNDSGASKWEELMNTLSEMEGQIADMRFVIDEVLRKINEK